jgi:hypothetical protein
MGIKKCPCCADEIQDTAIRCKHCGEMFSNFGNVPKAANNEKQKKKYLGGRTVFLVIVGTIFGGFFLWLHEPIITEHSSNNEQVTATKETVKEKLQAIQKEEWYVGGTLHKATMKEWSQATYENKLATASDFAVTLLKTEGISAKTLSYTEITVKPLAIELVKGLDEINKDGIVDNQSVSETTALLWVLMREMK